MKKMLCIMLSLIMVLGLLSGCDSLFTSGDEGGAAGGSTGDIKMTDKYTFTDPADLTFETRYALYCDKNSSVVSTAASYGVKAILCQVHLFFVGNNEAPAVGRYPVAHL